MLLLATLVAWGACAAPLPAMAQLANRVLFEEMAIDCLGILPETEGRNLILRAPAEMPYVRAALVAAWRADGHAIFLPDSAKTGVRVAYAVEEAGIRYERKRRKQLAREARLVLRYDVTDADGRVLADERCERMRADVIARTQRAALESEAWPETQGTPPRRSKVRRLLEPAVTTAAIAIAAWLFFSLRSSGENSS